MTETCRGVPITLARDRHILELIADMDAFKGKFSIKNGRVYFGYNPDIMPSFLPAEYPSATPFTVYYFCVMAGLLMLLHFGAPYNSIEMLVGFLSFAIMGFLYIMRLRTNAYARFKEKDTVYRIAREALCTMYNRGSCDEVDSSRLARYNKL